jgi:phosphoribosyl 1,2-cyclic phosphodiesterase
MDDPSHICPPPRFCVLASGSSGNCTVLEHGPASGRRLCLIDAGLSPRRTRDELAQRGLDPARIHDIVLTHLDHDHAHDGWRRGWPPNATLRVHKRHIGRAERCGFLANRCEPFEDASPTSFELAESGVRFSSMLVSHDQLGVAVFRIQSPDHGSTLGYATDLGRVSLKLIEHLAGVDVLAIESNYCPEMQRSSTRSEALKRRIMDGQGHLSNQQCADAVGEIQPREHVVLLHLSRQCNRPEIAAEHHAGSDYALTISSQTQSTRWVELPVRRATADVRFPQGLFA